MKPETREKMMTLLVGLSLNVSSASSTIDELVNSIYLLDWLGKIEKADAYRKEVAALDRDLGEIRKLLRNLKQLILDECEEGER